MSNPAHEVNPDWRIELAVEYLGDPLRLGRGKKEAVRALLVAALGKPCPYCAVILTVDNAGMDHKEPYGDSRRRRDCDEQTKRHHDRIENLQIICRPCNALKEDFADGQWRAILKFMLEHPSIAPLLRKRLSRSRMMWGKKR